MVLKQFSNHMQNKEYQLLHYKQKLRGKACSPVPMGLAETLSDIPNIPRVPIAQSYFCSFSFTGTNTSFVLLTSSQYPLPIFLIFFF